MQRSYNTGRQSSATERYPSQSPYLGDIRQSQYPSSGYEWSGQTQQNYADNSRQQTYSDGSWKDGDAQSSSYGESRETNSYATQSAAGNTRQEYYNSQSSTSAGQNTQGLNHLAYASALNDSGLQRQRGAQQSSVSSSSKFPLSTTNAPNRVQSPAAPGAAQYGQSQSTGDNYHNNPASSTNKQSAVAVALAGAVNRRFPQAAGAQSVSPVMNGAPATQSAGPPPTTSPYYPPNTQRQRQPSFNAQHDARVVAAQANRGTTQQISQDKGGQHARAPSRGTQQPSGQSQQQAPQVNSISNLVTHSAENSPQTHYSSVAEQQSTMPSYIDPTQVFNPFAREHEKRRREAEAEAKRKAEEEAVAAAAAKRRQEEETVAAAARKRLEEEAIARKKQEEEKAAATAAAERASQLEKAMDGASDPASHPRKGKAAALRGDHSANPPTPVNQSSEADMASELKVMMEKMKEFRSKDPTLFQKLWDDMRKPTAPIQSPSPKLQPQQATPVSHPTPRSAAVSRPVAPSPAMSAAPNPVPSFIPAVPLNGFRVVVEDNLDNLPDLGRFPAERRIRGSYVTKRVSGVMPTIPKPPAAVNVGSQSPLPVSQPNSPAATSAGQPLQRPPTSAPQPSVPTSSIAPSAKSPPLTQGLPPRGPNGGTIWPEEKRNALAEAAVKALKSIPANEQIDISPADIHAILEKNPGYIDLCQMLEEKGLKFHRGQFARQLLSNVPSLNTSPQVGHPPPPPQPQLHPHPTPAVPPTTRPTPTPSQVHISAPNSVPVSVPPPSSGPGAPFVPQSTSLGAHNNSRVAPPLPRVILPQFRNNGGPAPVFKSEQFGRPPQPVNVPRPPSWRVTAPPHPEPPQGPKEAMARKRDFSEIVDLTALSDDEDYVLSRKQARVESLSPERDPFREYQKQMSSAFQPANSATSNLGMMPNQGRHAVPDMFSNGVTLGFNPGQMPQHSARPPPPALQPAPPPAKALKILAKPINKDEALQKSYYNPKTVAHDILIAAGRHPTERPLNAHMAGLLGQHIHLDSDLGTFEWDAIDPGGPPVPQVDFVDVPIAPPRYQFGQRRADVPVVPVAVDRPVHAESRLPDSDKRDLPAVAQSGRGSTDSRQTRFTPQPHSNQPNGHARSSTVQGSLPAKSNSQNVNSPKRQTRNASVSSPTELLGQRQRSTRSSSSQLKPSIEVEKPRKMQGDSVFPSGKRRGRPPGAKNIHPSVRDMKAASTQPAQISVTVPPPSSPSLPLFRCRWKGCKAHLHNLDTLRQHIAKVHRPSEDEVKEYGYICWWKRCQHLKEDQDGLIHPEKTFEDASGWLEHVEENHLYPVAMKLGDGPSTKHIGKQKSLSFDVSRFVFNHPAREKARTCSYLDPQTILEDRTRYLSDEGGRVTTPISSTTLQEDLEPDTMSLIPAESDEHEKKAQRRFMATHRVDKSSSPKALAEETLRAMTARKAKIGPGIERGGCILVTEARRKTLIQNQGLARVVDADY